MARTRTRTDDMLELAVEDLVTALAAYSLGALAVCVLLVVVLHRVEPEFDPSWRMLSEYSLGRYGYLMRIAFVAGGTGVAASGLALVGSIGPAAWGIPLVALGPIGAAFVDTAPVTTPQAELSTRSRVHSALGSLYILGFPIAATVAGIAAAVATPAGGVLAWGAALPWIGIVWFIAATVRYAQPDRVGSPAVRIGWPNRWSMLLYFAWVGAANVLLLVGALG